MKKCVTPGCEGKAINTFCKKCCRELSCFERIKIWSKYERKFGLENYKKNETTR